MLELDMFIINNRQIANIAAQMHDFVQHMTSIAGINGRNRWKLLSISTNISWKLKSICRNTNIIQAIFCVIHPKEKSIDKNLTKIWQKSDKIKPTKKTSSDEKCVHTKPAPKYEKSIFFLCKWHSLLMKRMKGVVLHGQFEQWKLRAIFLHSIEMFHNKTVCVSIFRDRVSLFGPSKNRYC